jgi:hypothetical protein
MRTRRGWFSIEVVLLIVMTFSWRAPASAAEPLFAGDDVLELTIHGPLTSLTRGTPGSTPVAGRKGARHLGIDVTSVPGLKKLISVSVPGKTLSTL